MKIEEIKAGILVMISSVIEEEIDGIKRRKGALGMVDSPVFGSGGTWWWIVHQDGSQIKYRSCEISEMKTIRLPDKEKGEKENSLASEESEKEEVEVVEDIEMIIEKWID